VLWRVRLRRTAITTGVTWFVCLCFSVSSAIGIYVQERTSLTGGRTAKLASYEDARTELADVERKLKGLAQHRSVAEVEAAIAAVFARTVFVGERIRGTVGTLSANCTNNDKRTAEACAEVAGLREELAIANESTKLEGRATGLRQQVSDLRATAGSVAPDPVGEFWEWITRGFVTVRAVGFGLPLFFALMIETVSAFGPLAIVAYADATRRHSSHDTTRSVAPSRAEARVVEPDRSDVTLIESEISGIVPFMAARTEPTADPAAVSIEELHTDYELWCSTKSQRPLTRDAFATEFDRVRELPQLEGKIRKFGTRYYGIRLFAGTVTQLPTRKRGDK